MSSGALSTDTHGEIAAFLDIFGPWISMHCEPLSRQVVTHKKEHADGRKDSQKAGYLLFHKTTLYLIQAPFDKGTATIIGKEAE